MFFTMYMDLQTLVATVCHSQVSSKVSGLLANLIYLQMISIFTLFQFLLSFPFEIHNNKLLCLLDLL